MRKPYHRQRSGHEQNEKPSDIDISTHKNGIGYEEEKENAYREGKPPTDSCL